MAYRYAIYWAPPRDHPLWRAGCAWLGRDPETGETIDPHPEPIARREEHARLIADAARYGWHATLKAPFRLAEGETEAGLDAALAQFAAERTPFPSPPLIVASLAGFLAVVPGEPSAALSALADDAVRAFDRFRAPPTAEELAKRVRNGLTPRQQRLLDTWGYPYVMEEWRFHMTLTVRLPDDRVAPLRAALAERFAPALAAPPAFREVALYVEPEAGAPFRLLRRYPFKAG
ncbi:DUF1045 domain-containing protein [Elioraea thermophila]|uniref:DUF1045 domain-containing protein n=1 Tax=Elioraea thermophila TaxID=2185104 RepID=UPI0018E5728D|nr:DUF1045 domain-containing protein [Elioraea thermophila]